jgi:hypothetical protein
MITATKLASYASLFPLPTLTHRSQRRGLDVFIGGGSIGYCDRNRCKLAHTFGKDFPLPNGLVRGPDGLIYVPSTVNSEIRIFSLDEHHKLTQVDSIKVPLPMDNLSFDANGDLIVAAFPRLYKWTESSYKPFDVKVPSAVLRVRRRGGIGRKGKRGGGRESVKGEWEIMKLMEDDGSTLPGATIAAHDVQTGRIFLGGAVSPFITICETRLK